MPVALDGERFELDHGSVVIAAITSCTNTSNPQVLIAAGLLAKAAVERGLERKPWVKSSLAPGSKVVSRYLELAGWRPPRAARLPHRRLWLHDLHRKLGPLPQPIRRRSNGDLVVAAVLSGNRNFEARIHAEVKANYLASPPLVVAYALTGRIDLDLTSEPLGKGSDGRDVYLVDIWPSAAQVQEVITASVRGEMFREVYADVYAGDKRWRALPVPGGDRFAWAPESTYIRHPRYSRGCRACPSLCETSKAPDASLCSAIA